uniref:Secreted SPRY domain-containing protein 10 n=1 Tax=Globodera rostochiensis TaxID=31243 RepID=I7AL59_GLORO|nr:secreted SPRY domain-containing protein 10 [Globodera rostochiensis]
MRFFHFLDAVCLFVVATFILLETDAQPKTSNTKLKNKGPTSSGNAKPNPGLTLGNRWDSDASDKGLTLSPDQLIADYTGLHLGHRSVSAEQPIPKIKSGFFYYEVETLEREGKSISIGLGPNKGLPTGKEIGVDEGYAYDNNGDVWGHKVDGCFNYHGRPYIKGEHQFADRDAVNGVVLVSIDVVGCGVNLKTGQIFYTQNGVLLNTTGGRLLVVDLDADLFPTVSLGYPGNKIEANFGSKEFKFNITKALSMRLL